MGNIKKIRSVALVAWVLLSVLTVTVAAQPDTDPMAPIPSEWVEETPVIDPDTTESTTPSEPTESQPTVTTPSATKPTATQKAEPTATTKAEKKAEHPPLPVRGIAIYSLIALVIMVGGGVAIYVITTHQTNDTSTPGKH